jgi:ABC-type branched-chain amino acid transport systems, ATPase component
MSEPTESTAESTGTQMTDGTNPESTTSTGAETTVSDASTPTVSESTADPQVGAVAGKEDAVLHVDNLQKSFGGLTATDHATFEVERGTITGLIGPNGAGKSTLFNLISGFLTPDGGTISVNGSEVTGLDPHKVADYGLIRDLPDSPQAGGDDRPRGNADRPAKPARRVVLDPVHVPQLGRGARVGEPR